MVSRYCSKCGRVVAGIANFCPWGCGSLENEPILEPYTTWEGRLAAIEKAKKEIENRETALKMEEINSGTFQIKLF